MEKIVSKARKHRQLRDEKIREKYNAYMDEGSDITAVYDSLAETFHVSRATIIRIVKNQ